MTLTRIFAAVVALDVLGLVVTLAAGREDLLDTLVVGTPINAPFTFVAVQALIVLAATRYRAGAAVLALLCTVSVVSGAFDAVVATALATISVAQILLFPIAPRAVGVAIALLSTVPIAFRRPHPLAATLVGLIPWAVPTDGYLVVGYVAVILLFYMLAVEVDDLRVVAAATAFALALSVVTLIQVEEGIAEYLSSFLAVVAPVGVGRLVRRERDRAHKMAVAEERARIARELHDVVAHGVSVIAVQADAAEAADAAHARRAARGRRGHRARSAPDRAGGAHQRAQARPGRADHRAALLVAGAARAGDPR